MNTNSKYNTSVEKCGRYLIVWATLPKNDKRTIIAEIHRTWLWRYRVQSLFTDVRLPPSRTLSEATQLAVRVAMATGKSAKTLA